MTFGQWSCDCIGLTTPNGNSWVLKACDEREERCLSCAPREGMEDKYFRPFTQEETVDLLIEMGTAFNKAAAHDRLKWVLQDLLKD